MKLSDWLDEKEAENVDVSKIKLPRNISYDADPDEIVFFQESNPCGLLCSDNHPFSKIERYGHWYFCRGQDKKAGIHSSKMKWHLFTKDKDFAQAYVIAHEVGHHVQNLLGISSKVHAAQNKLSETDSNKLSVKQELQADCLAGVWANHANHTRQMLEIGDVEEGLTAASAIGDDTLQKQSQGYVSPDSFTHGSSDQRVKWFKIGLSSGNIDSCDTFNQY